MWNLPVCSSCSSEYVFVQELFCTRLLSQENTLIRIFVVTNDEVIKFRSYVSLHSWVIPLTRGRVEKGGASLKLNRTFIDQLGNKTRGSCFALVRYLCR